MNKLQLTEQYLRFIYKDLSDTKGELTEYGDEYLDSIELIDSILTALDNCFNTQSPKHIMEVELSVDATSMLIEHLVNFIY